jgi:hypothetical protein
LGRANQEQEGFSLDASLKAKQKIIDNERASAEIDRQKNTRLFLSGTW